MAAPMYNGLPDTGTMTLLGNLETGKVVTIFFSKKKPERRTMEIKPLTSQLVWIKAQGVRPEGSISFRDIKEIRRGKSSKDFDKWPDDTRRVDQRLCFIVYYGHDFKLHSLSVVASSPEERDMWVRGIDYMMEDATNVSYVTVIDRWLAREFNAMTDRMRSGGEKSERLALKNLKSWMARVNYKISTNRLRENFQHVDAERRGELTLDEFMLLFHRLVHVHSIIEEWFGQHTAKLHNERIVTVEKFQRFLIEEQKEFSDSKLPIADITVAVKDIMKLFLADPGREIQSRLFFSVEEYLDYLFSKHNTIWESRYDKVHQDMTKPLSWYWIASSHNTYLTGDQISSESSVEAYAHCLRMGCKCLEWQIFGPVAYVDCWDGPDGYPQIYHGHTLTSRIRFLDVLKSIKEHAWDVSDYPLILSIENHCSLGQQRNMASAFKDIFGDMLLTDLLQRDGLVLPSPDQLKRKILLKHKKLPTDPSQADPIDYTLDDNARDGDLSNSVKNGILYLDDPIDQTWSPHFFVLTSNRLYYSEETTNEDEDEEEENTVTNEGPAHDELHYGEKWFHGRLSSGRHDGERLLKDYSDLGDGTFLVRESETFVGDFSLSFRWQGLVNHCRIKSKQERGQVKYYLIDNNMFDSLYSLIMYYRAHPLKSNNFTMTLKEPVPQPQSHEGKEWYHERCDRDRAEEMLKRIPYDGAFLVRRSESDQMSYAISFRAEGKIKHCRIRQEGRLFTIGTAEFESLVELVQYYEKYPLYKKMKLRKAVSDLTVEIEGVDPSEAYGIYGQPDSYINPNDFTSKEPGLEQASIYESGIYHIPNTPNTTSISKEPCMFPVDTYYDSVMYTQPNMVTSKVRVKALHDYQANRDDELSFCKGCIITNVNKHDNGWWKGDYLDKSQFWFPANFVAEIEPQDDSAEAAPLGSLQKGAIDVQGCVIDPCPGRGDKPYCFKIFSLCRPTPLEVACDSETDMKDWIENIKICANNLHDQHRSQQQHKRILERKKQIAQEFSDLIVYCIAVQFDLDKVSGNCCEMSSFQETKAEKLCTKSKAKQFIGYNRKQLSRVYPKGPRVDSSNYDPVNMWNCGSQMLALNYQTPDRPMQINLGRFSFNGSCGYVLQPECMRHDNYSPFDKKSITIDPLTLSISVIGARHLMKSKKGIVSPFVEIEIIGLDCDCNKFKTVTIPDSGLNPVWNRVSVDFDIVCPDLAIIRFVVQDEDVFGDPNFLGQATYPIKCLRQGYRSVPLKNEHSEPLELSALLVSVEMRNPKEEDSEIYSCLQDLLEQKDDLSCQAMESEMRGDSATAQEIRHQLHETEQNIIRKNEERRQRKSVSRQRVYRRTSTS